MQDPVPPDFGRACGMALTKAPFVDQAIVVSTGGGIQASILDFRSQEVRVVFTFIRLSALKSNH